MPGNFHTSAHDIELKNNHKLKCKLKNSNGKVVEASIDLNDYIGNSDGWFKWDSANFSKSARNVCLREGGTKLEADLPMANGGYRERQGIMLSDRIENCDGKLVFIRV
ncbi:Cyanovirin-N [Wilcoxina mikolae CBS 423.85]|nr:Cyanovirin-N [Wilcoxina mikolae CBS 423.85]